MPLSLLEQYQFDTSSLVLVEKLLVVETLQGLGVFYIIYGVILVTTANRGTSDQQETTSLITGVANSFSLVMTLSGLRFWGDVGVPASGTYFNALLWVVLIVLSFLGASFRPVLKLAQLRKPMHWGFLAFIAIFSCYFFASLIAPESLLAAYTGVGLGRKSHQVLVGLMKYAFAQTIFAIVAVCVGHIATASSHTLYCVGRFMCCANLGLALVSATWVAVWTCLDKDGIYGGIVSGQCFNVGLWVVLFLLFFVPIAGMDPAIKDGVEKEVEGAYGLLMK
jgi:hypothetical protein